MSQKEDKGARVNQAVLDVLKGPRKGPSAELPPSPAPSAAPAVRPTARTWVGRVADEHNSGLKSRIQQLEQERSAGLVVLRLDPKRIRPSTQANRHALSLVGDDPEFAALLHDIGTHGQLDPIRVRPVEGDPQAEYEIVYGHRRHAASLLLDSAREGGFAVLALLDADAVTARDHVLKMYQENAARKDLSAFETGAMFRGWLDADIFADQAAVAAATGLSVPSVSKYLQVAALPSPLLAAFRDPRVIAVRWAEQLGAALKQNEKAVLGVAARLAEETPAPASDVVLRQLLAAGAPKKAKRPVSQSDTIKIGGRVAFAYSLRDEKIAIRFGRHVDRQVARELTDEIKELLTTRLKARLNPGGTP